MSSSFYIVIYVLLWAVTLFFYWKKRKTFNAGTLLISTYFLYAILSFFLYENYYKYDGFGELELFPFLYLYSMLLICLQPVLRFDENLKISQPSLSLLSSFTYVYLMASAVVIPVVISKIYQGIFLILTTDTGGEELYYFSHLDNTAEGHSFLYSKISVIFNLFSDFIVLVFFYYLTLPKVSKKIIVGLFISIIICMLQSIAGGGRTGITMKMLVIIASFFLFKNRLSRRIKTCVYVIGSIFISFAAILLIVIGESRFSSEDDSGGNYQLLNYVGQAPLWFNKYGLDAGGIRYGDRTCSVFKKMITFEDVPMNYDDCRQKHKKMKLDDSKFSTFVGDFSLDFGPIGAALFLGFFSILFVRLTSPRDGTVLFHQLILIFLVMSICMQGGMYLFLYSYNGNYVLIGYLVLYYLFKLDYQRHNRMISA